MICVKRSYTIVTFDMFYEITWHLLVLMIDVFFSRVCKIACAHGWFVSLCPQAIYRNQSGPAWPEYASGDRLPEGQSGGI